ncbi:hypothetical protein GALMADRAFT_239929 [Galerina marginata CBS 339.88]|uniref:Replication factor A C-terminal domain-containing protein n=1 Tax=Galerina marginata (strain CBS 339.88) TaxID=685588 RepID=A0A067TET4_GALM3|nr:hypothetical protein GALMADRAFT_239929 [Galerina marginata CBS 339.88]
MYVMLLAVADYSGQAQDFDHVGTTVFNVTANQLLEIKERDPAEYDAIMHRASCNTFNFSCRAKQDTYTKSHANIIFIFPPMSSDDVGGRLHQTWHPLHPYGRRDSDA